METYLEKAREIEVTDHADVLVAGAGPAGYAAALAAARNGARTILVEQFNCVGGMATSGLMSHFSGAQDSPMFREIIEAMKKVGSGIFAEEKPATNGCIAHEPLKYAMLRKLEEAGVILKLYTFVSGAIVADGTVKGILCESKSGRSAIFAKVVVDATGDGDVAARAGAEFQFGREGDGVCQPVTLMFRVGGVDKKRAYQNLPGSFESYMDLPKGEVQHLGKTHLPPPAGHVLLYETYLPDEICVNMTNVTGIDGTKAEDLTKAELVCRDQMDKIVLFLREYVPGFEHCYLVASAQNVGVRETRHIRGVTTITAEDILEAKVFPDWIATRNYFNFDIHNTVGNGLDKNGSQKYFRSAGNYTIPYGACVPVKLDGLLTAGRCISGTHKAHSNFRVMSICMNIGHGVGTAAALAAKKGIRPRDVDPKEIQAALIRDGVKL